jgi:hypothetical protein
MRYSTLQEKIIKEKRKELSSLVDDERFLHEEIMSGQIENYNFKVRLAETHNQCKV